MTLLKTIVSPALILLVFLSACAPPRIQPVDPIPALPPSQDYFRAVHAGNLVDMMRLVEEIGRASCRERV